MPTFGSLFAGIGGIDLGLERAGWECRWQVEVDDACTSVLARHWPDVPLFNDIREVSSDDLEPVDLIAAGFPCQDISVAGRRTGLAGQRSGLFWEFMRLVDELSPAWLLAENVPGLLSSGCKPKCDGGCVKVHGGDMGAVIGALADRGYGYAWRVLDAQFFGLAQRRKRVFIVGHLGEPWSASAQVLFESESLQGDPPTRSATEQDAPSRTEEGTGGNDLSRGEGLVPEVAGTLGGGAGAFVAHPDPARAVLSPENGPRYDLETETLAYSVYPETGQGADLRATPVEVAPALTGTAEAQSTDRGTRIVQSFAENQRAELRLADISPALSAGGGKPGSGYSAVLEGIGYVRRLTPLECERLQGFPDGWTLGASDSKRYRMLGNAVATPVAEWVGNKIIAVREQTLEDWGDLLQYLETA